MKKIYRFPQLLEQYEINILNKILKLFAQQQPTQPIKLIEFWIISSYGDRFILLPTKHLFQSFDVIEKPPLIENWGEVKPRNFGSFTINIPPFQFAETIQPKHFHKVTRKIGRYLTKTIFQKKRWLSVTIELSILGKFQLYDDKVAYANGPYSWIIRRKNCEQPHVNLNSLFHSTAAYTNNNTLESEKKISDSLSNNTFKTYSIVKSYSINKSKQSLQDKQNEKNKKPLQQISQNIVRQNRLRIMSETKQLKKPYFRSESFGKQSQQKYRTSLLKKMKETAIQPHLIQKQIKKEMLKQSQEQKKAEKNEKRKSTHINANLELKFKTNNQKPRLKLENNREENSKISEVKHISLVITKMTVPAILKFNKRFNCQENSKKIIQQIHEAFDYVKQKQKRKRFVYVSYRKQHNLVYEMNNKGTIEYYFQPLNKKELNEKLSNVLSHKVISEMQWKHMTFLAEQIKYLYSYNFTFSEYRNYIKNFLVNLHQSYQQYKEEKYFNYQFNVKVFMRDLMFIFRKLLNIKNTIYLCISNHTFEIQGDTNQYKKNIQQIYELILEVSSSIMVPALRISTYEDQHLQNSMNQHLEQFNKCIRSWEAFIYKEYRPRIIFINERKKNIFKESFTTQLQLIKDLEGNEQKIIEQKTMIQEHHHVLDVKNAKNELIILNNKVIGSIYLWMMMSMNQEHQIWSKQMIRTQRLSAQVLSEEQDTIIYNLSLSLKKYKELLGVLVLDRKKYYRQELGIYTNMSMQTLSKTYNKLQFFQLIQICYVMEVKTQQKIDQIHILIENHKKKTQEICKTLEQNDKKSKNEFKLMTLQIKKILKQVKSLSQLVEAEDIVFDLNARYQEYEKNNEKLMEDMKRHGVIVWANDEFLPNHLELIIETVKFINSEKYRKIHNLTIDYITFEYYFQYFKKLEVLISKLNMHKFENFFIVEYENSSKKVQLLKIALYKEYAKEDIQALLNLKLDVRAGVTDTKILDLLNWSITKPMMKSINTIYQKRKTENYHKNIHERIAHQILLSTDKNDIFYIQNIDQITMWMRDDLQNEEITGNQRTLLQEEYQNVKSAWLIYEQLKSYQIILKEDISPLKNLNLSPIVLKAAQKYKQILERCQKQRSFTQIKKEGHYFTETWRQLQNHKVKEKYHQDASSNCSKFSFIKFDRMIKLLSWQNLDQLNECIKYFYSDADSFEANENEELYSLCIKDGKIKDEICINSKDLMSNIQKKSIFFKNLQYQIHRKMHKSLSKSINRTGQMKIVSWMLFFTEQIQCSINLNSSLQILKQKFKKSIKDIEKDLRYDATNHKECEIGQLVVFINYIEQKLGKYPQISGYPWESTIKFEQKILGVQIKQFGCVYNYGYEPKKAKIINELDQNISPHIQCKLPEYLESFIYLSYVTGRAYFHIESFAGISIKTKASVQKLIKLIDTQEYFIAIAVTKENNQIIKDISKEIYLRQFIMNTETFVQQERKSFYLYMVYGHQNNIPHYLAQKYRSVTKTTMAPQSINYQVYYSVYKSKLRHGYLKEFLNKSLLKSVNGMIMLKEKAINSFLKPVEAIIHNLENLANEPSKKIIFKIMSRVFFQFMPSFETQISEIVRKSIEESEFTPHLSLSKKVDEIRQFLSENQGRVAILYGEETSCKTYVITEKLDYFFNQKFQQATQLTNENISRTEIVEASSLDDADPSFISKFKFFYFPNSFQNEQGLKKVFMEKIRIKIPEQVNEQARQQAWDRLLTIHDCYKSVNKEDDSLSLRQVLDILIKIWRKTIEIYLQNQINDLKVNQFHQLVLFMSYEFFLYSIKSLEMRQEFYERLQKIFSRGISGWKVHELDQYTCTHNLSIEKVDLLMKKHSFSTLLIPNKEQVLIEKYKKLGVSFILTSKNSMCYEKVLQKVYDMSSSPLYQTVRFSAKATDFMLKKLITYQKHFQKHWQKSMNAVSRKVLEMSHKSLKNDILEYQSKSFVIVEDMHLSNKRIDNKLKIMTENFHILEENKPFLLLTGDFQKMKMEKRCRRHYVELVVINQKQYETIYKYRSKLALCDSLTQSCEEICKSQTFSKQLFMKFLMETTVKLPSQFYAKFFPHKFLTFKLYPQQFYKSEKVKISSYINQCIEKYKKHTGLEQPDKSAYIKQSNGILLEVTQKNIQKLLSQFIEKLDKREEKMISYFHAENTLPFCLVNKCYIIQEDVPGILPRLIAHVHSKTIRYLTSNYLQDIKEGILAIKQENASSVLFIAMPYLTSDKKFLKFINDLMCHRQIFYLYQEMYQFWQELISEKQYVNNTVNQSNAVKNELISILKNNISVILCLDYETSFKKFLRGTELLQSDHYVCICGVISCEEKRKIIEKVIRGQGAKTNRKLLNIFWQCFDMIMKCNFVDEKYISIENMARLARKNIDRLKRESISMEMIKIPEHLNQYLLSQDKMNQSMSEYVNMYEGVFKALKAYQIQYDEQGQLEKELKGCSKLEQERKIQISISKYYINEKVSHHKCVYFEETFPTPPYCYPNSSDIKRAIILIDAELHIDPYIVTVQSFLILQFINMDFINILKGVSQSDISNLMSSLEPYKSSIANFQPFFCILRYCQKISQFLNDAEPLARQTELNSIQYLSIVDAMDICQKQLEQIKTKSNKIVQLRKTTENCIQFMRQTKQEVNPYYQIYKSIVLSFLLAIPENMQIHSSLYKFLEIEKFHRNINDIDGIENMVPESQEILYQKLLHNTTLKQDRIWLIYDPFAKFPLIELKGLKDRRFMILKLSQQDEYHFESNELHNLKISFVLFIQDIEDNKINKKIAEVYQYVLKILFAHVYIITMKKKVTKFVEAMLKNQKMPFERLDLEFTELQLYQYIIQAKVRSLKKSQIRDVFDDYHSVKKEIYHRILMFLQKNAHYEKEADEILKVNEAIIYYQEIREKVLAIYWEFRVHQNLDQFLTKKFNSFFVFLRKKIKEKKLSFQNFRQKMIEDPQVHEILKSLNGNNFPKHEEFLQILNSTEREKNNPAVLNISKMLEKNTIVVFIYQQLNNQILREIMHSDKNVKIVFTAQEYSAENCIEDILKEEREREIKGAQKTFFLIHEDKIAEVDSIFHFVPVIWI